MSNRQGWVSEHATARLRSETGQVFVLFALMLPVLLGLAAVVVDAGGLYFQKRTLRGAADAAALAAAQDLYKSSCSGGSCVTVLTGQYSGLNNGKASTANLVACATPASWNCYTWPYNGNTDKVEVKLRKSVPTAFARVFGITNVTVSGRAVATVSPGQPPPYSFVALNSSSDSHTLIIRTGGNLIVHGTIYTNSSNDDDGFDVFGAGGSISAPQIINHGGWETHDGNPVIVNGITCPFLTRLATDPPVPGCPVTGQPVLADPFVGLVTPPPLSGTGACLGTAYITSAYSPAQTLKTAINSSVTTLRASGNAISAGDTIQIDSERMTVNGAPVPVTTTVNVTNKVKTGGNATLTANGSNIPVGTSVTVAIGDARFNGTYTVTAQTANTFTYTPGAAPALTVTNKALAAGIATLTTSVAHGMLVGDTVTVAIGDKKFDGTFTITARTATTFSYSRSYSVPTTSWAVSGTNVATLTATTPPHDLAVGNIVTISGFGGAQAFLNGAATLTAVTANTFSYARVHAAASGTQNVSADLTTVAPTAASGTATPVNVASVAASGTASYPNGYDVSVTRGVLSTTATAHSAGATISKVTATTVGTPASPAPCTVSSGSTNLSPGTYYGGIAVTGGTAHLSPGTYIMAGGGLKVTGAGALDAPNVLIYNTNDPGVSGNGAFAQFLLDTTGSVTLGAQTNGQYQGLTIFQDPTRVLDNASKCNKREGSEGSAGYPNASGWDIGFRNMADKGGAAGKLGSVSGTIYAPQQRALFGAAVSGKANLAVITGCIFISGLPSEFEFQAGGLFGGGSSLTE